jgi:predicted RNase H-like HicB family nuclease
MTYRIQIERDESGAWIARALDVPGCHTYGRTLRQVKGRIREALGLWVDDARSAELLVHVRLPAPVRNELRGALAVRRSAIHAQERAQERLRSAVVEMTGTFGLSLRDAADLIGLSHQRVQQLVAGRSVPERTATDER